LGYIAGAGKRQRVMAQEHEWFLAMVGELDRAGQLGLDQPEPAGYWDSRQAIATR